MAIVNSIILGKAKGSLGNVTLTTIKGRVIAKQKATMVSNPKTEGQVLQRNKMSKAVLAYQLVGNYVKSGITSLLPFSSAYNTYISKNMEIFKDKPFTDNVVKGTDLVGSFATIGKLGTFTYSKSAAADKTFTLKVDKNYLKNIAKEGDKVKVVAINNNTGNIEFSEYLLTSTFLSNTTDTIQFAQKQLNYTQATTIAVWVEAGDGSNSTTSVFKAL